MTSTIGIFGEGMLAEEVHRRLRSRYETFYIQDIQRVPEKSDFVLVLHDHWAPSVHETAEHTLRKQGLPWLRGFVSFGEGVIGPVVYPDRPGCSFCADIRRLKAGRDRSNMIRIREKRFESEEVKTDVWATRTGLGQMALLVMNEVENALDKDRRSEIVLINLHSLACSRHFLLPDSSCPVCSPIPDDSKESAVIELKSCMKTGKDSFRCRTLEELEHALANDYLDRRTGLFNDKMYDSVPPFADVIVNLPLASGDEGVAGRTNSYKVSEMTAMLEGLERACGISPIGKRTVVHDCFRNVADDALDPRCVGLHANEQYGRDDFPFRSFSEDANIDWVWGYSFKKERPILVPERLAYYSLGGGDEFVYETSNGCAIGGSLEESIFYGMMEVIERDSFLLTWYAQLPLPPIDPYSSGDKELSVMIDRIRSVGGYDIHLYNATMEHGIPSVWAMAKNRKKEGLNLICAAGAHLDPVRAVKSSLFELAAMMLTLDDKFKSNEAEIINMYHDSSKVKQMDDHGMLYGLRQAEERLGFLLEGRRRLRTFEEEFEQFPPRDDLTEDLNDVLQRFLRLDLDVIVVDQTAPEIRRNGLHCVKVIIPGLLPMTFGHHLKRLEGLERLLTVPLKLGYANRRLTYEELNPYPHPFP